MGAIIANKKRTASIVFGAARYYLGTLGKTGVGGIWQGVGILLHDF
jgi:hypothetical protein